METYRHFHALLKEQLNSTARFLPAAFHVHSPDSYDWGRGTTDEGAAPDFSGQQGQRRFLDSLVEAGLELVCVTDHMKADYACSLAKLAATRDDITVLPGMEISCTVLPAARERIHVLVVFPAGTEPDVFERLFHSQVDLPSMAARRGDEEVRFDSLRELRDQVHNAGGLLVLAHVDASPRGHRAYVRSVRGESATMFANDAKSRQVIRDISSEYAEHLVALAPHAVEVMHAIDRHHYSEFTTADGHTHGFPCIARSDHHHVDAFGDQEAVTYIKVSRSDLACVKQALNFYATRVRFPDNVPTSAAPRIVGVRLRGAGLFADSTIAMSENLTCLIGARGCGKSTVIEALRYVLGQRPLLETGESSGHSFADLAIATQNANLRDTEIELIYEADGEQHVLAATFDRGNPLASRAFSMAGEDLQIPASHIPTRFPARIFSWSELETLGRDPALQRTVVDRLAGEVPGLLQEVATVQVELRANRDNVADTCRTLRELLAARDGALRCYSERAQAYKRLNTPEVRALFEQLDDRRARISLLEGVLTHLRTLREQTAQWGGVEVAQQITAFVGKASGAVRAWWSERLEAQANLAELEADMAVAAEAAGSALDSRILIIQDAIDGQRAAVSEHEKHIREQTQATSDVAIQSDQRETARVKLEAAQALRHNYQTAIATLWAQLGERAVLLKRRTEFVAQVSAARIREANKLGGRLEGLGAAEGTPAIAITVGADQDRARVVAFLHTFLNPDRGGQYKAQQIPERLATVDPVTVAWAILTGDASLLVGGHALTDREATRLVQAFQLFTEDPAAGVTCVSDDLCEVLELQEQAPDDLVRILSGGRPVDELSPGGRSSVMLPLVALSDNVPLIIDQPEDNLDNRMVGRTLSSILANLKEHRQVVVTTHNPNIVVGGDAEQVVVMSAPDSRSARVETTGSIDDPGVIESVIKIMEGGKEAFEERHRRYSAHAFVGGASASVDETR